MEKILFQGDSITDWFRIKDNDSILGSNYVNMVAGEIGLRYPNEYEFINRGIGGNRSIDILARTQTDIISLKPDYLSMLVGVNDVWHAAKFGYDVNPERYELYFNTIIQDVKKNLPNTKIMIMEPFILKGSVAMQKPNIFIDGVNKLAQISRKIASNNNIVFVALQERFDKMLKYAPVEYWSSDGVHPNAPGHCIIKNAWIEAFERLRDSY